MCETGDWIDQICSATVELLDFNAYVMNTSHYCNTLDALISDGKVHFLMRNFHMLIVSEDPLWAESLNLGDAGIDAVMHTQIEKAVVGDYHDLVVINSADPETAISLCRQLRPRLNGALLLYTDVTDEAYQRRAYAAGVNECVPKPITSSLLTAKLAAWRRRIELDRQLH
jgi:CheY-like chemotaxis protein